MRSRAVEAYKRSLKLSTEQKETLVGLLLGDACLETSNRGRTFRLKIEQSARHREYVRHLYELFQNWVLTPPRLRRAKASNGTICESWVFSTVSHSAFRFFAHQFYGESGKQVPRLIHRWLTPRGLAHWFMDDGSMKSLQSKGVIFNTQGFAKPGVERLIQVLQSKFGFQCSVRQQPDGWQIYVSGASFETLQTWICPYLIESMTYKLPCARRTRLPKE